MNVLCSMYMVLFDPAKPPDYYTARLNKHTGIQAKSRMYSRPLFSSRCQDKKKKTIVVKKKMNRKKKRDCINVLLREPQLLE